MLEGIDTACVDQVILGNILGAGQGMNVARQVGVHLGLPVHVPAFTVNMMCASGMQAVALAAQAIRSGAASTVLCGGTESMSNAPYLLPRARRGLRLGDGKVVDSMLHDGLIDAFDGQHMAHSTEALAARYNISRDQQDRFALLSQQRHAAAAEAGRYTDELVPVSDVTADEHPRPETTLEDLAALKPAFIEEGTITAGNASGINDGAALLLVTTGETAKRMGWPVLAVIEHSTACGCEPAEMGLGPVHAIRKLSEQTGNPLDTYDTVEINEAFAAQTLACLSELDIGTEQINRDGGAIAVGHPIGASGARLLVHLAQRIAVGESHHGLAALCVGGGMGIAMSLAGGRA